MLSVRNLLTDVSKSKIGAYLLLTAAETYISREITLREDA